MEEKLQLALNQALELAANREMNIIAQARAAFPNGGMGIDEKRPKSWCEYGFPDTITDEMLFRLYRRRGLAAGAVNKLVARCWKTYPELIEGDEAERAEQATRWESGLRPLIAGGRFWSKVQQADARRLAGRYSGLILRVADSKTLNLPVTDKGKALAEMVPVWGKSLRIKDMDETTGAVTMWEYTQADKEGKPKPVDLHPDRVFILGSTDRDAIAFLEPAYNNFVSLEKVEGGSGESFLKNASRQLNINFDKDTDLQSIADSAGVALKDLQTVFDQTTRGMNTGIDSTLVTKGANTSILTSAVADPGPTYDINLQTAAAALDIPTKILVGMQTGERASTEDEKAFNSRCQSRRRELAYEIYELFRHLQRIGVVQPVAEFTAVWDDLTQSDLSVRLTSAKTMAEINEISLASGGAVYTTNQILTVSGFDTIDDGDDLPEPPEPEPDPDPTAPPAPPVVPPAAE